MQSNSILYRVWQLPVILAWRFAIFLAAKTYRHGFVICDITSTESKYRDSFAADVQTVLDQLAVESPKVLQELRYYVRYVARAQIQNRFDYYSGTKLLLLNIDYETGAARLHARIKRDVLEFLDLANDD